MIAIDFEKSFDSLSWNYLFKTLEISNFGREFQNWIKLLSSSITGYELSVSASKGLLCRVFGLVYVDLSVHHEIELCYVYQLSLKGP